MKYDLPGGLITGTDSYKVTHWPQYPPGTETVYSYLESRGSSSPVFKDTCFFGLQYYLKAYLEGQVVTREHVEYAATFLAKHFGSERHFNRVGWLRLVEKHGGRLPLLIKAVPEGTVVPTHNVLMTIENTDPEFFWLTNWMETLLLKVWYPITVATLSREIKKLILGFLEETGDPALIGFKLHDFGCRGVSSQESAAIGGAAHLVNFFGTDTLPALELCRAFYQEEMAGFSVAAAEHSTMTSWGREHEADAMRNILEQFPTGIVACVSDQYDILHACREIWGKQLKPLVEKRDGTLVVRPDSGDPPIIVSNVLMALAENFPPRKNAKGYQVLPDQVRVIQGDGVNIDSIYDILAAAKHRRFAADNVTFGMGGALLQQMNRDTLKFAIKCSHVVVNGEARDVWKDPVTDPGKVSKKGRLKLVRDGDDWQSVGENEPGDDQLVPVFRDGEVLADWTLSEIRERARVERQ